MVSQSTNEQSKKNLRNVSKLVNCMLKGKVNVEYQLQFVYGANLCALTNKYSGLRPIAVGCVFCRLTVTKICCISVQEKCKTFSTRFCYLRKP